MSAAAVASPAPAAVPASAFSAITLFECTISNAQMLVESMELVDLILAQKIVCQLHGRLVEVMEPSAGRLAQQLAEMHSQCQSLQSATAASTASTSAATATAAPTPAPTKCEPQQQQSAVKLEAYVDGGNDEDVDDNDDDYGYGYDGAGPADVGMLDVGIAASVSAPSAASSAAAPPSSGRSSGTGGGGGGGGHLPDKWKHLLRESYRLLKYQRGELFDFTRSYSSPVNLKAADAIIQKAIALSGMSSVDVQSLKGGLNHYLSGYYRMTLKPRKASVAQSKFVQQKLSRRQRSYDNLLTRGCLTALEKAKMAALLDRRYTSSDEEDPDADAAAADDAEASVARPGQRRALRVRRLAWESAEAARLKAQLDRHFADAIASPRERQEVARLRARRRGDGDDCVSDRPPPDNPLDWAVASADCGDEAGNSSVLTS